MLTLLAAAAPLETVDAVVASLESQETGANIQSSQGSLASPAAVEDEEEEDQQLDGTFPLDNGHVNPDAEDGGSAAPAAAPTNRAFLPPQPAGTPSQVRPQHQPEAVFHFTAPHHSQAATVPTVVRSPVHQTPGNALKGQRRGGDALANAANISMAQHSWPAVPWPPPGTEASTCNPPCIQGRGICNDNVCFCKSPFSGSTCQHKIQTRQMYRFPKIAMVAMALFCIVVGLLAAKLVFAFTQNAVERRLAKYGEGKAKFEQWQPHKAPKFYADS